MPRVNVDGWSLELADAFSATEHEDSVRFSDGARVVYVSATAMTAGGAPVDAETLHERTRARFTRPRELRGPDAFGWAERIASDLTTIAATREAAGSIATCLFQLAGPADQRWALRVWRSMRRDG